MMSSPAEPALRAPWRKSTYSNAGNDCVEIALYGHRCAVRDSKSPTGPRLLFTAGAWAEFASRLKDGAHSA